MIDLCIWNLFKLVVGISRTIVKRPSNMPLPARMTGTKAMRSLSLTPSYGAMGLSKYPADSNSKSAMASYDNSNEISLTKFLTTGEGVCLSLKMDILCLRSGCCETCNDGCCIMEFGCFACFVCTPRHAHAVGRCLGVRCVSKSLPSADSATRPRAEATGIQPQF
jgi:hypothetical protein